MTGTSTLSKRRLPASLSRRLINKSEIRNSKSERNAKSKARNPKEDESLKRPAHFRFFVFAFAFLSDFEFRISDFFLVVARDRFDGGNHLFVGHFVGGAEEAGVASVHEDGAITFGVAAQSVNQLPPFGVVQGTEVHGQFSFQINPPLSELRGSR